MNAMTRTVQGTALVTEQHAAEIRSALKSSLYPGASDASIDMVLAYCKAAQLDPMTKPVHIVPMTVSTGKKDANGYDIKEKRDVVMPGIGLYRINAARTGQYAGCSEPEFGPTRTMTFKREKWVDGENGKRRKTFVDADMHYPEWCRITVRRLIGASIVEFTALEYWLENYASKGDDGGPNAMWEKRPFGQIAKCAEAQALRKAFPEAVGSQPTAEEMEGKSIDIETVASAKAAIEMPRAKAVPSVVPADAPIDAEFSEQATKERTPATVDGEPGPLGDLSPSQARLIRAKAVAAGFADDAALLAAHPDVSKATINTVLKALSDASA
ncbi:hypothetical protein GCM10009105_31990 [Dokdonella soli]|uniref:Phage recombination protein Bet n=3 Tax=Dokdonella soli TaxID=529810 RepID=A0ABN1IUE5_9GAMM